MKNIVNITKCDKGFIGGLSEFYRSLVGVSSGYKHFSVRRVVLLLALILTLGAGNAWGDNLDFSGNSYIFIKNIKPDGWGWGSPFMQNVSGEKDYLYVWGNNSASGYSEAAVLVSGTAGSENAIYAVKIPNKNLYGLKLYRGTSFTTTDGQYWNCTGDMYFNTGKNYLTKYGNSYTWDNYVPTSTASLSASSTSITTIQTVTLTPSLSKNTAYNEIKSTSYSVTTNPGSAGSVTSAGVFSATAAGTYIVTATVTYNAKDFTGTTTTATATKTITVTAASEETHDVTVYYKYGSTTVKTETTESAVGVTTARSFTAPVIDGYNFFSYTFGDGLTMKSANTTTNPCSFVTKTSGTYSLTVNYNIAPVKLLYGTSTPLNSTSSTNMTYDATKKAYYVDVTTTASPYYFRFDFNNGTDQYSGDWNTYPDVNAVTVNGDKVSCSIHEIGGWTNKPSLKFTGASGSAIRIWFSYKDKQAWITENTYTVSVASGGNGTVSPASVTAGKNTSSATIAATPNTGYYFKNWTKSTSNITIASATSASTTVKTTSAGTVTANFSPQWTLAGSGTELGAWNTTANPFTGYVTSAGKDKGYFSATLLPNTIYQVKVYDAKNSKWYGLASGASTVDVYYSTASTEWTMTNATGNQNLYVHTSSGGTYTFEWNLTDNKLKVSYPTSWYITMGVSGNGTLSAVDGSSNTVTDGSFVDNNGSVTFTASPSTGYHLVGWYSNSGCTTAYTAGANVVIGENTLTLSNITANKTVYAKFAASTYTATLSTTGEGYGSGAPANQTVTYNSAMPAITPPTAANGYAFMGYWDAANGTGTQYYTSTGASARTWNKTSGATLYAYFKKAEITAITLSEAVHEPVAAGGEDVFVTAEPTIAPNPVGTVTVCWELRYSSNGNPVDGVAIVSAEDGEHPNKVKFAINGLATGSYKLHAVLRLGSGCSGTELGSFDEDFRIASDYTVTVKYMCGDVVIKTQTTTPGSPINWTDITAPDVIGYSFSKWKAGDGITIQGADANGEKTTAAIKFKADYDGTLTANYTRKRTIYFNNMLGWSDVYVYFYNSNEYWSNTYGTGAKQSEQFNGDHKPYWEQEHGHMTRIEGTNIWYYDCSTTALERANVVFTEANQHNYQYFNKTKAARRGDYSSALPMFVPLTTKSQSVNNTDYYNNGYWMNYPENTGYILHVYDRVAEDGAVEVASMPFEFTENKTLPMSLDVLLDAAHTYGFKIERADGAWFGNNATMKNGASGDTGQTAWEFKQKNDDSTDKPKCGLLTTAAGTYTFTLNYANKDGYNYVVGVHYPNQAGDLQILYNDRAAWSLGTAHTAAWVHPSRLLTSGANKVDTISFFVAKDNTPALTARKIKSITAASGAITWEAATITSNADLTAVSESGVYNFKVTQNAAGTGIASIENIGKYEGDYYIRCGALNSKWGNFRNDEDHLMTYSAFSESSENSFGDKFSHYKAKWCPRGTNVMFCIANDYSLCITDTLIADVPNTYNNIYTSNTTNGKIGDLKAAGYSGGKPNTDATADQYSANIRFMWNRHTNKISRAYVASSTNTTRKFLMLKGCNDYLHSEADAVMTNNETLLQDDQNWIYEVYVKARPGARVKLYACYGEATANEAKAQYFRGTYDSGNCGTDANSIQILGGSGSSYYKMRVIYDFKTNRLVSAWLPDGTDIDQKPLNINADVMIIRDHQNPADAITLTSGSSLGQVKTVYGVMRFNRWTLNNRYRSKGSETVTDYDKDHSNTTAAISEHHAPLPADRQKSSFERNNYFISFPFDVRLSEVFGFGTYGTHWIISEYKGKRRAERGYFIDNCINEDCTNWDYVIPDLGYDINSYVLEKNKGYLLSLDLDLMQYDDTTHFWLNQIQQVELFFPSSVPMETITSTNVTMPALGSEYECKINYDTPKGSNPEGDRRVKDSYWRCIGVPSYASYGTVLKNESSNDIQWQANYSWEANPNTMPFLYEWNTTDNTLTPQSTKTFTFKPMHAYLVQCKNEIRWTAVNATPASIVARQRQEAQNDYTWTLLLENGDDKSETFIRLTDDEQVTDTFDFGQDMYKEFRDGFLLDENGDPIWDNNIYNYKQGTLHSDLYSLIGTERVAANSLPLNSETTTIVPLGVRAKAAGEYSISLPDGSDGVGVTLVDSETGTRTNLSAGLFYTLDLPAGQTENRLYLEISPVKHTATGIGETDSEPVRNAIRKVLINGILYIVRDGQLYTVTGARVE
ncbi:MAG: hypothetical protein IJ204_00760 [Paludibacteraceae bacterium]|nr:hypothetical protein [Paludibacteraceae bacterium]